MSCAAVACANITKPNSPAWLNSNPRRKLRVQLQLNAAEPGDKDRLRGDHGNRQSDDEQRPRGNEVDVEKHPYRQEEQAEQDRAERLDIAFELVTVGRFREHHAGDERPQRDRQMERMHDRCRTDHGEQPCDNEQLALAETAHQPKQRVQGNSPYDDEGDHRQHRIESQPPSNRRARIRSYAGHCRDDRDHRYDGEVLEQQDRKGTLALRRIQLIVRPKHRQHLGGRRERERKADRQRRLGRKVEREVEHQAQHQSAQHDLREAQPEYILAEPPQPARLELETDNEQQ